jgi:hypothetical protein
MTEPFNTDFFLKATNLFWQYPVETEKVFYEQNKHNPYYCGIPWATILDKNINLNKLFKIILLFKKKNNYYTCCQHIYFRKLIPLMKHIGIRTLYTPHKIKGEDSIDGILIYPCPLYAVNVEDKTRNSEFENVDFITKERNYLYSFMGGVQSNYISSIRNDIFSMNHINNSYIKNTGDWHFNNVVYSNKQNTNKDMNIDKKHIDNTKMYNNLLLNSRYSLCPSGSGPNSIRFWESLAIGSIPILLSDTLELPYGYNWDDAIVRIQEKDIYNITSILSNITEEKENDMRKNCIIIYNKIKNSFVFPIQNIIHYCNGSYDINDFGGVARYDYHISLILPHRIFIKGPQQKDYLLELLNKLENPIVITDNHLTCDIPDKYNVILVHHGCALTHAEREPQWDKYWKELCCNGQKEMLNRNTNKTRIISSSTFCTDEFARFFPIKYKTFENKLILHTSELNINYYKTKFNDNPIIFGNFAGFNKGEHIYNLLKKRNNFNIEKINVKFNLKKHGTYMKYNEEKQMFYINRDIYLQLSLCEGFSYATLDAFACGNVIVATNVGLTYKDVPENCYVKLDYRKINDIDYIEEKINYAWLNRETLSKNARNFFVKTCNFHKWKKDMYNYLLN